MSYYGEPNRDNYFEKVVIGGKTGVDQVILTASASGLKVVAAANPTGASVQDGLYTLTYTNVTATPSNVRAMYVQAKSGLAVTSGTFVGIRGELYLSANYNGFGYGVQGKLITNANTIAAGSNHVCAVMAQVDYSGATLTSGHLACLVASVQNSGAAINATAFDPIYIEAPTYGANNWVNSYINMYGSSKYVFAFGGFDPTVVAVAASDTTISKKLKILVNSTPYYIALTTSV